MLQINSKQVFETVTVSECIEIVDNAMKMVSRRNTRQPNRWMMPLDEINAMGIMPGAMNDPPVHGIKLISLYPGNVDRGLSRHLGVMLLFESGMGTPVAVLDASALTAHRTAAATAAATRALARKDARTLAVLGSGEQARHHLPALKYVRDFESIRVWSRTRSHADALVALHKRLAPVVEVAASAEEAVRGADVIVTLTASSDPILKGEWLEPGQHVNLVGSSTASSREIDEQGVARGRFFVDCQEAAELQAGELVAAIRSGLVSMTHIVGEIGAVFDGNLEGRISEKEITIYKSLGTAAQDLSVAHEIYRRLKDSKS